MYFASQSSISKQSKHQHTETELFFSHNQASSVWCIGMGQCAVFTVNLWDNGGCFCDDATSRALESNGVLSACNWKERRGARTDRRTPPLCNHMTAKRVQGGEASATVAMCRCAITWLLRVRGGQTTAGIVPRHGRMNRRTPRVQAIKGLKLQAIKIFNLDYYLHVIPSRFSLGFITSEQMLNSQLAVVKLQCASWATIV